MAVGTADLHQALRNAWNNHGLDHEFKKFWAESKRSSFPVLHEQQAGPSQPFPYCVYEQGPVSVMSRMTSSTAEKNRELRDLPFDFTIYARKMAGRGAKDIAQELIEMLLKKFGGHPDDLPVSLVMSTGSVYQIQYQSDLPSVEGDDEYSWKLSYKIQIDVPVKVAE